RAGPDTFPREATGGDFQSEPGVVPVNVVLPAPKPIPPAVLATVTTTTPTFQWSAVPGAAYYKLVAIDEASPDSVALEALKLTGTSFTPSTPLLVGHAYSWYVQGFVTPWGVETAGSTTP